MAASVEYEVRDQYRDTPVTQLLTSPVTCFQGVGDTQKDILEKYFGVTTVIELANLTHFLEALQVQELAHQEGVKADMTVEEISQKQKLDFSLKEADRNRKIADLLEAPAHVLEDLTPAQDLAYYDAFRITNLSQLAHNRIMLEARVIAYLAEEESGGTEDALAKILGAKQAASARRTSDATPLARAASEVSEHVKDRLAALRDRDKGRGLDSDDLRSTGLRADTPSSAASRLESIRAGRERTPVDRASELARIRAGGDDKTTRTTGGTASRVGDILAARGGTAPSATAGSRPSTASKPPPVKEEPVVETPEVTEQPPTRSKPPARQLPPPGILIIAAVLLLTLLVGIGYLLFSGDEPGEEMAQTTETTTEGAATGETGEGATDQTAGAGTGADATTGTGADATTGTGAGTTTGTGAGTTTGTGTVGSGAAEQGAKIREIHKVGRGESLWRISNKRYRDPLNWPSIYLENQAAITHPDLIKPNQELRIPETPEYRFPDYPEGYRRTR